MAINLRSLANAVRSGLRILQQARATGRAPGVNPSGCLAPAAAAGSRQLHRGSYPGDFRGHAAVRYAPKPDGDPDPGEVV